jgi:hypothetical protein
VAIAMLAACDTPTGVPGGYTSADETGIVRVRFGADPLRWHRDAWSLDSVRVDGDTLFLSVRHGGGCAQHGYALVAWNGWLESEPVQADVLLAHDARDDPCDALLSPRLRFDLSPLRAAWTRDYGAERGTIRLRITDPASPAFAPLVFLTWTF